MTSLKSLLKDASSSIKAASSLKALEEVKVHFLGKKGLLTGKLKELGGLPAKERAKVGQEVNQTKSQLQALLNARREQLDREDLEQQLAADAVDVTLQGRGQSNGGLHPITLTLERIEQLLATTGFEVVEGPEIESDYYNFEVLNIPSDHPARAMHDTFYVDAETVLRTHTSPVQVRVMKNKTPPLRVIAPGRVYRCDSDVTHTPMFHQVEGFMVDTDISFANLKL